MKRHRQKPNEEYNFWQPATDMMSGLVFVLVLIIALLGLYLLSDYTGYEEASSVSSEGPSSSGTGWNNNDPGGWYYDGGTGDGDGDGNGQFDQQIIQTGGGGGGYDAFSSHSHAITGRKPIRVHNALKSGEKVILIRMAGGQKYLIIDRVV